MIIRTKYCSSTKFVVQVQGKLISQTLGYIVDYIKIKFFDKLRKIDNIKTSYIILLSRYFVSNTFVHSCNLKIEIRYYIKAYHFS